MSELFKAHTEEWKEGYLCGCGFTHTDSLNCKTKEWLDGYYYAINHPFWKD